MSFIQRIINAQFELGPGKNPFPGGGSQLNITGLRANAKITKVVAPAMGLLYMQIWGMTLDEMKALSTMGVVYDFIARNVITVTAGDTSMGGALPVVFKGIIMQAWIEASRAPDVSLNIEAHTLADQGVNQAPSISISGVADGVKIMEQIAKSMKLNFDNSAGVKCSIFNPNIWGSLKAQAQQVSDACGWTWSVDDDRLVIAPKGKGKGSTNPVVISPKRGTLVGYPTFANFRLRFKTPFNPNFKLQEQFTVEDSQIPTANATTWHVLNVEHDIESMTPNGNWFSVVEAWNSAYPAPPQALTLP